MSTDFLTLTRIYGKISIKDKKQMTSHPFSFIIIFQRNERKAELLQLTTGNFTDRYIFEDVDSPRHSFGQSQKQKII